jgi:hypothetical protein
MKDSWYEKFTEEYLDKMKKELFVDPEIKTMKEPSTTRKFMIDIETLGNKPGEVILEIGIAEFNDQGVVHGENFLLNVFASIDKGFKINQSTIKWWNDQDGVPTDYLKSDNPNPIFALDSVSKLLDHDDIEVWSKGFMDIVMLEAYFVAYNMSIPWKYYQVRDLRTALAELNAPIKWNNVAHTGLDDALMQISKLLNARK